MRILGVLITPEALILACKDVGSFLAAWTFSGIKADVGQFCLSLATFVLINVPSDLLLMNHWKASQETKKKGEGSPQ